MAYARKTVNNMDGYTPGYQPGDGHFIKLNTNESPYPPSPKALQAMRSACSDSIRKYPDPMAGRFRAAAAKVMGIGPDEIICGFGSDDLLTIAMRTFCDAADTVAFPYPSYSLYDVIADIQGAAKAVIDFPDDFSLPEGIAEADARLTLIANPNAPSGTAISPCEIKRLAGRIKGVLLIDEAYADFSGNSCIGLIKECENLIITRTLSKAYSLAGLRFGFAAAHSGLVEQMVKVKDSYNVSSPAIEGAAAAIEDTEWLRKNTDKIKKTRALLISELTKLGFYCWPSETNFVLARVPAPFSAPVIFKKLFERKILVRFFDMPRLNDCLRITVGTDYEIEQLTEALKAIIKREQRNE